MAVDVERARRLFTIEEYVRMHEQYAERLQPARGTSVASLAFPDAAIAVDAIFV